MTDDAPQPRTAGQFMVLALGFWFVDAVFTARSGVLTHLPFPVPALVPLLTGLALAVLWLVRPARGWAATVDLRTLVALHLTRFVGAWFFVLYHRGELPWAFAVPGGWGDIAVAALGALVLISFMPVENAVRRRVVLAWNALGFLDILFVAVTAARLSAREPGSMSALTRLPMSLLPTFLVPLIIVTHVLIFARLARDPGSAASC